MPDIFKDYAIGSVATPPSPATTGTSLTLTAGHGARLGPPPFDATICPVNALPDPSNAEMVRVTAIAGDVLTIVRSSTPRTVVATDLVFASLSAQTLRELTGDPRRYGMTIREECTSTYNGNGQFAVTVSGTGASHGLANPQLGHPGVIYIRGGTAAAAYAFYLLGTSGSASLASFDIREQFRYDIGFFTPAAIGQSTMRLGVFGLISSNFGNSTTTNPYHGVYFQILAADGATPHLKFVVDKAGIATLTDTGVTIAASTFYTVQARYDGTNVYWSVNRAAETAYVPGQTWPPTTNTNGNLGAMHFYDNTAFSDLGMDYVYADLGPLGTAR